jgi:hypothetical protein
MINTAASTTRSKPRRFAVVEEDEDMLARALILEQPPATGMTGALCASG